MKITEHWHIDPEDHFIDTYKALTLNVPITVLQFSNIIKKYNAYNVDNQFVYAKKWLSRSTDRQAKHHAFAKEAPWSDWYVVDKMISMMPRPGVLHMANSTPVRYVQLFDNDPDIIYQCNRGVSGIDGCNSTAVGYAQASEHINTLVTGDVAFFYDSNALWHAHVPNNLRIVLLNNEGGNIFRVIPGPDKTKQLGRHFESHHNTSAEHIATAYGIDYIKSNGKEDLDEAMKQLYSQDRKAATILEVFTPRLENDKVLKAYFKAINKR
jgi:2-succinyl-5-enolpyruvyl-6-hydroxy-3-cyclohexene-1-carboxylate synthase